MMSLSEAMGDFWADSSSQAKFVSLEDVAAQLHMEEGSAGYEMVFDSELQS